MNRHLYRCRHNQRVAGVAAGVAEFFDLDPTLVRVLFFLSIFFGGLGLLLYIGMAIIVPLEPVSAGEAGAAGDAAAGETPAVAGDGVSPDPAGHRHTARRDGPWTTLLGGGLILFGSLALIDRFLPAWDVEHVIGPVILIGIGALLVTRAVRREPMES